MISTLLIMASIFVAPTLEKDDAKYASLTCVLIAVLVAVIHVFIAVLKVVK